MRRSPFRLVLLVSLVIALAAFAGCSDDSPTDFGSQAPGTLRLNLTDAPTPIEGVEALHLLLSAVRVNQSSDESDEDGGWFDILPDTLTEEERTIDLLEYSNGEVFVIGEELIPSGSYEQIRLVIEESTVTVDGTVYDLKIPSGSTSGLKLIHGFTVDPDQMIGLTLD